MYFTNIKYMPTLTIYTFNVRNVDVYTKKYAQCVDPKHYFDFNSFPFKN